MKQSWMSQAARSVRLRHQPAAEGVHIATGLRRLVSLLWILLLVVCVTAVAALQTQANEVNQLTRAIGPASDANSQVLQVMSDAETGLLAYQASLDPGLLAPYRGAETRTMTALAKMHDKLILATGADDKATDTGLEARQRLAVQQWWTYASAARAAVARGERTNVAEGDALFVSFRRANAELGSHLTAERDESRSAAQTTGARGTAISIAVTLVALLLASVLGRRAARSMSRPMAELRDAMTRQHGGESDARAREDQGSAELRSLAADFNALTQQNHGLNAQLTGRLTELRKVNNNLREVQHLLTHQTLHDPLTRLPNRTLFLDRLDQSLADAVRSGRRIAVYFLDIDEFKQVNDTLGHSAGDQLLNDVANRLRSVIRPGDTVARFAGDEFLVLTQGADDGQTAALADRVLGSLLVPPLQIGGETVTASMGVAISDDVTKADQLLQRADAAMYQAKRAGGARWRLFGSEPVEGDVPLVAAGPVSSITLVDIPPRV